MTGSSALMPIGHIFLCYILLISFNKPIGHGAPLVKSKSHATPSLCTGPEHGLRVVHKYGPCSPFGQKKSSATSSQILALDERKVQVRYKGIYNRRAGGGEGERERDPDVLKDSIGAGNYLVQASFGTPVQTFNLTLDTGSYKTWVRCQPPATSPCPKQQNASLYYPFCSSTYSNATCSTPPCNDHDEENYMDKSEIDGTYVADTLRIEDGDEIPKFVFLCAYHEKGEFEDANGILGLGLSGTSYGSYALTTQTAAKFHKVFCHCLPTVATSDGYVYFGEEARKKCPFSGSYTPLLSSPSGHDPSFYYVNLISITIGQKRVNISSSVSSPPTILDSGTIITRLPSSVYSVLRSEFRGLMSEYPLVSSSPSQDNILDTCYNLKGYNNPVIPKMVLHFENLDLELAQTAVTWRDDDTSQVCFAFAESKEDGLTIIGNHQQQKRNILYNIPEERVEIGQDNC